jgi:hypothetical protein
MKFYADWAMRIGEGHWTDGAAFYGLPGYAFCLAGFFQSFGFNPFLVGLVQVVLEATTTVFIFRIAKESFSFSQNGEKNANWSVDSTAIGAWAALAWIFYLPAQAFSTVLMPNAWLLAAFWGCVWWLIRRSVTPQTWAVVWLRIRYWIRGDDGRDSAISSASFLVRDRAACWTLRSLAPALCAGGARGRAAARWDADRHVARLVTQLPDRERPSAFVRT